ncbi:DUF2555 domain-containing protein [Tumidithrix helvetica PCC 7403]|uniref:protein IsiD n=1 Tax=Tumidithrix helvetica TaxID=3457545 RepID=UPI003C98E048
MGTKSSKEKDKEIDIDKLTAADVAELAARLEADDYPSAFESLQDWHTLRALAFKGSNLIEPYYHLLDMEAFDEC